MKKFLSILAVMAIAISTFTFGDAQRFGGRSGGFSSSSSGRSSSGGFGGRSSGGFNSSPRSYTPSSSSSSSGGFGGRSGSYSSSSSSSTTRRTVVSPARTSTSYNPATHGSYKLGYRPSVHFSSTMVYGGHTLYMYPGGAYSYFAGGPIVGYYSAPVYGTTVVATDGGGYVFLYVLGGIVLLVVIVGVLASIKS